MRLKKHAVWLIGLVVFYGAWMASPALAHAELVRSIPEANAILDHSPAQIELFLSEPIEAAFSQIKVFDTNGHEVDAGKPVVGSGDPEWISRSLVPLPDGIYTVSWVALSEIDGHLSAGSFPFAVGKVDVSALPEVEQTSTLPIIASIAKWLLLVSIAILAGGYPSMIFVWLPTLTSPNEESGITNRLLAAWNLLNKFAWAGLLLSAIVGILAQAGQASGRELAIPWTDETIQLLTDSRLGVIWLIRLTFALYGLWMARKGSSNYEEPAQFILGLALLMTISLTSHSATELHPLLPVLNDWLHLIAMTVWLGGLAYLIVALAVMMKNVSGGLHTRIISLAVGKFSNMALPTVGVVGLTGIYSATLRVGTIAALTETNYGHSLLFKQGFVAALILMAATNLLIISPGIRHEIDQGTSNSRFVRYFEKTVLIEVILACLLLANVTVMTYLPPAMTPYPSSTLNGVSKVDNLRFSLFISPGLVGRNAFIVQLSPSRAAQDVNAVTLTFVPVTPDVPPSEIQLTEAASGLYTAQGSHLAFPGRWLVEVAAQRKNSFTAQVSFDFIVTQADAVNQNSTTLIPQLSKVLIVLILVLIGANLLALRTGGISQK